MLLYSVASFTSYFVHSAQQRDLPVLDSNIRYSSRLIIRTCNFSQALNIFLVSSLKLIHSAINSFKCRFLLYLGKVQTWNIERILWSWRGNDVKYLLNLTTWLSWMIIINIINLHISLGDINSCSVQPRVAKGWPWPCF